MARGFASPTVTLVTSQKAEISRWSNQPPTTRQSGLFCRQLHSCHRPLHSCHRASHTCKWQQHSSPTDTLVSPTAIILLPTDTLVPTSRHTRATDVALSSPFATLPSSTVTRMPPAVTSMSLTATRMPPAVTPMSLRPHACRRPLPS